MKTAFKVGIGLIWAFIIGGILFTLYVGYKVETHTDTFDCTARQINGDYILIVYQTVNPGDCMDLIEYYTTRQGYNATTIDMGWQTTIQLDK